MIRRLAAITSGALWLAWNLALVRRGDGAYSAVAAMFERLGGGFVKLGQLFASGPDLLPPPACLHFSRMLDRVSPEPFELMDAVIRAELREVTPFPFVDIEHAPLASASIAQIHAARLLNGAPVVIKVKRPGVDERLRTDLALVRLGLWLATALGVVERTTARTVYAELSARVHDELDFYQEMASTAWFAARFSHQPEMHRAPKVIASLCTARIIVMERLGGHTVHRDVIDETIAHRVTLSLLEQALAHGGFQADPHAGNFLIGSDGVVEWIDFGYVGWMADEERELALAFLERISNNDLDSGFTLLLSLLGLEAKARSARTSVIARDKLRAWMVTAGLRGSRWDQRNFGVLMRCLHPLLGASNGVSPGVLRFFRAFYILDATLHLNVPSWNMHYAMKQVFKGYVGKERMP